MNLKIYSLPYRISSCFLALMRCNKNICVCVPFTIFLTFTYTWGRHRSHDEKTIQMITYEKKEDVFFF